MNGMNYLVDINCDMGEGMPDDAFLMPFISSSNIACGYHAGDEKTMHASIELALQHKVAIGVHPSYEDKENFGRTNIHLNHHQLYDLVSRQIEILANIAQKYNAKLHHVKPHGALYNMAAVDPAISTSICSALQSFDKNLILYGLSGSKLISTAFGMGIKAVSEVFADRTYQEDGTLTPRNLPDALLSNREDVGRQVLQMVMEQKVKTTSGINIPVKAETICLHGDGVHALAFAQHISNHLQLSQIKIQSPQ